MTKLCLYRVSDGEVISVLPAHIKSGRDLTSTEQERIKDGEWAIADIGETDVEDLRRRRKRFIDGSHEFKDAREWPENQPVFERSESELVSREVENLSHRLGRKLTQEDVDAIGARIIAAQRGAL